MKEIKKVKLIKKKRGSDAIVIEDELGELHTVSNASVVRAEGQMTEMTDGNTEVTFRNGRCVIMKDGKGKNTVECSESDDGED